VHIESGVGKNSNLRDRAYSCVRAASGGLRTPVTSGLRSSPLQRLAISECPLGQLLRTRERVRLPMIIDYEEFYANQQRDHQSGLREFRGG
jgi:hypothetical protein